jgi:hypothetical protein
MGRHQEVLDQATALLAHLDTLPADPDPSEPVQPWQVRETVLDTARAAAFRLADWPRTLELLDRLVHSKQDRGASDHELARTRFNAYAPLVRLSHLDDAEQVLLACQQVFEATGDTTALGNVFSARADLKDDRGHHRRAVELEQAALRFKYRHPELEALAISHHNLAACLGRAGHPGTEVVGHRLAAALLVLATGRAARYADAVRVLTGELRRFGEQALPADLDQLAAVVQAVPGVRFADIYIALVPDLQQRVALLADTIHTARRTDLNTASGAARRVGAGQHRGSRCCPR